jgi:hypothetical protein
MTGEQVGGIVRALLSAIGGYLVGKGLVDEGTMTAVVGAGVTIVTAVWSVLSKRAA